jgi:hypothetical protein
MERKYEDIINMSDKDVIAAYDTTLAQFWREEIKYRQSEKQTQRMLDATIKMESATQKMLWVAVASVAVSVLSLIMALNSGCH